jgi:7,8-dihydropterin-6-yl-methyl-4-(beta-D-ribofuranosyl)aminobenzene 5'-phosphate synthase
MEMSALLNWGCLISAALCAPSAWAAADAPPPTSKAHKAEITILYDAFGKSPTMKKDWGFAALIEYGGKRILFLIPGTIPRSLRITSKPKALT